MNTFEQIYANLGENHRDSLTQLQYMAEANGLELILGEKIYCKTATATLGDISFLIKFNSAHYSQVLEIIEKYGMLAEFFVKLDYLAYPIFAKQSDGKLIAVGHITISENKAQFDVARHSIYHLDKRIETLMSAWGEATHRAAAKVDLDLAYSVAVKSISPNATLSSTTALMELSQAVMYEAIRQIKSVIELPETAIAANLAYTYRRRVDEILDENLLFVPGLMVIILEIITLLSNQYRTDSAFTLADILTNFDWKSLDETFIELGKGWIGSLGVDGRHLTPNHLQVSKIDDTFSLAITDERRAQQNTHRQASKKIAKTLQDMQIELQKVDVSSFFNLSHQDQQNGMCPVLYYPRHLREEGIPHMYELAGKIYRYVLTKALEK